jgi:SAM-dependent methyltransferase
MYAELEVHRTMIRDRVRTEAFRRAIESVVRPGDVVLDVGAGSGILSLFAARAGAVRVYAVEATTVAVVAQGLAAANGVAEIVQVIQGDVMEVELPERVDVIVSEWLGGFGIDEGMLGPVIAARDRWLKPGGVMIPRSVTAWTALVHDRYIVEMVEFLRDNPYGIKLGDLVDMTVNEIFYSGTFRHLAAGDRRSEPGRLWTTDADLIPLEQAQAPHEAETLLPVRDHGTANALALWFSAELAPGNSLSVGPGDPPTHWGMTTAPLRRPVELTPGMVVRARVRTAPARPTGTWTSWPSRCQARAGRSTTSRRSGRRSTTKHSRRSAHSRRRKCVVAAFWWLPFPLGTAPTRSCPSAGQVRLCQERVPGSAKTRSND